MSCTHILIRNSVGSFVDARLFENYQNHNAHQMFEYYWFEFTVAFHFVPEIFDCLLNLVNCIKHLIGITNFCKSNYA